MFRLNVEFTGNGMYNTYSAAHIRVANGSVLFSKEHSCSLHFHIKIPNNQEKHFWRMYLYQRWRQTVFREPKWSCFQLVWQHSVQNTENPVKMMVHVKNWWEISMKGVFCLRTNTIHAWESVYEHCRVEMHVRNKNIPPKGNI